MFNASPYRIAPYQPRHRQGVLKVAELTGDFGKPMDPAKHGPPAIATHFWAGAYLRRWPEFAFIALDNAGEVMGYGLAAPDTQAHADWLRTHLPGWLLNQAVSGAFNPPAATAQLLLRALAGAAGRPVRNDDLIRYPAHFHLNLREEARGQGLGKALLHTVFQTLSAHKVFGVHCVTSTLHTGAADFYKAMGMTLLRTHTVQPLPFSQTPPYKDLVFTKSL